ncbi:unnamed protein product [Gongylonema pulchrum]|uniref:FAT domain-containing protein n=1 Tax=Gongylonema pulchrum TaxID=637853 RepID=A0A183D8D2_9BILA|nr:unnamed protein product [Gongylonema pulchrum]
MNEMRPLWIKYASLCRQQGKLSMSRQILTNLLGLKRNEEIQNALNLPLDKPSLVLAVCKQFWAEKRTDLACNTLEALVNSLEVQKSTSEQQLQQQQHRDMRETSPAVNLVDIINVPQAFVRGSQAQLSPKPAVLASSAPLIVQFPGPSPNDLQQQQPQATITQAMRFYADATAYDSNWYKAWHKLASAYYNAAMYQSQSTVSYAFFAFFF